MNIRILTACSLLIVFCGCLTPSADQETSITPFEVSSVTKTPSSDAAFVNSMIALVDSQKYSEAIRMAEASQAPEPHPIPTRALIAYLDALVAANEHQKLADLLFIDRAPSERTKTIAAWALIQQGDRLMKKGDSKAALLDGYLKACVPYYQETCMRRRALEKTITVLRLQNDSRAEQFEEALRTEFPENKRPQQ